MITTVAWVFLLIIAVTLLITWAVGITLAVTNYWPKGKVPTGWATFNWMLCATLVIVAIVGTR